MDWTGGLDWWTGLLDWTAGLDWWTGLVDWTSGLFLCPGRIKVMVNIQSPVPTSSLYCEKMYGW